MLQVPSLQKLFTDNSLARHLHGAFQRPWSPRVIRVFRPFPTTDRRNTYILLFTDGFSRHASLYAVTAGDFAATGVADILVHDDIKHYGCPKRILSDDGPQLYSDLSDAPHKLLGIRKITTSAHDSNIFGDTGRANHTMAQM